MNAAIGLDSASDAPQAAGPETGDADLVVRAAAGEAGAFGTLMARYSPVVLGYFYGRVRVDADREDLLQEVFLEAFRQLSRLRRPERFGPWLMRIARSKLLDFYRHRQRHTGRETGGPPEELPIEPADPAPGPREALAESELHRRVRDAIGAMGDKYRTVLYMRLIADEEPQEIARRLGIKESAARMRLKRGLEMLRKKMMNAE